MPELTQQAATDTWLDRVIDNRYRIIELIGKGGMGRVYKVVHTQMGKVAAMKVLHGSLAKDKELVKRFHLEAEAISKLNHPNIVQVFDFGRVHNTMYLVMEYLRGEDLAHILRRDGPMDVWRAFSILIQICDALIEAHGLNIIHRDLKPENVRISRTRDGQDFLKVLDFGLAKILDHDEKKKDHAITARGSLVGTPYYMAPEMIRAKPLDHRIDIYSLGAMSYRMLTAQNAFVAKTPIGVLTKHLSEEPSPPSVRVPQMHIPAEMDAIVMRAMEKDPDRRFSSVAEMKHQLLVVQRHMQRRRETGPPQERRRESDLLVLGNSGITGPLIPEPLRVHPVTPLDVLSKEDLAFERKLSRGSWMHWLLILPLVIGIAGFAAYWLVFREKVIYFPNKEMEPNNTPMKATLVKANRSIAGHIGRRVSATESDRDWYKFDIPGPKAQMIQARVGAIRNMDITLELFDAMGGRLANADSSGKGSGEIITNWVADPGQYFLLVREVWMTGVAPTENVTDAYSIKVLWTPYSKEWELEPNNRPDRANPIKPGDSVRGYLGGVKDHDLYKITADKGLLAGVVSGIKGVDLVLEIIQRPGRKKDRVVDDEAQSAGERFNGLKIKKGSPVLLRVRRKKEKKVAQGIQATARGLDEPYTLKTWLVPTR